MPFRTARSKIYQYDLQIGGRRLRGSTGTDNYEEAKSVEAEIRAQARKQKAREGHYTVSQALGTYYTDKAQHQPSATTTRSQAKGILSAIPGKTPIDSLSNADVLKFVARRRAEVSNATVNRQLQLLGRALRHMQKFYDAEIPELDLKAAETPEPKERIRELTRDEQQRLFDKLRTDLHPFVTFALMTGARISTIANLRWSDVHIDLGEMVFRLKGGDTMKFPISREMRAFLSALPKSNTVEARRYVFTYVDQKTLDRKRIIPNGGGVNADFREAVHDAEIEDFRFHDLRHTFATRMLRQTQNLKLVSKLLGHKNIETTTRYAHVLIDDMRSALDDFSPVSGGNPQIFPQSLKLKY